MSANNILQLLSNLTSAGNSALAGQIGGSAKGGQLDGAAFQGLLAQLGLGANGKTVPSANGQSALQQLMAANGKAKSAGGEGQIIPSNVMASLNGILANSPETLKALIAVNASGAVDHSAGKNGMPAVANLFNTIEEGGEVVLADIFGLSPENSMVDIQALADNLPAALKDAILNIVTEQSGAIEPGQVVNLANVQLNPEQLGTLQSLLIEYAGGTISNVADAPPISDDGTIITPLAAFIQKNGDSGVLNQLDPAIISAGATKLASAAPITENSAIVSSLPETLNLGTLILKNGEGTNQNSNVNPAASSAANTKAAPASNMPEIVAAHEAASSGKSGQKATPNNGVMPSAEQATNNANVISAVQTGNKVFSPAASAETNSQTPAVTALNQSPVLEGEAGDETQNLSAIASGKSAGQSKGANTAGQNGQEAGQNNHGAHVATGQAATAKTASAQQVISQQPNVGDQVSANLQQAQSTIDTALTEAVAKVHTRPLPSTGGESTATTNGDISAATSTSATGSASLTSAPTLAASLAQNKNSILDRASLYHSAAVASNVGLQIAKAVSKGQTDFAIRIDPPELGRLNIKLEFGADTGFKAIVTANNRDTFNMLQRDSHMLEKALEEAGIDMSEGSLEFSLNEGEADSGGERQASKQSNDNGKAFEDAMLGKETEELMSDILPYVDLSRALDIRV